MGEEEKLIVGLAEVKRDLQNWQQNTLDYRHQLTAMVEEVKRGQEKLYELFHDLPCAERRGWYNAMNKQLAFMWGAIAATCGFLIKHMWGM